MYWYALTIWSNRYRLSMGGLNSPDSGIGTPIRLRGCRRHR
jgi:hypothetical protein